MRPAAAGAALAAQLLGAAALSAQSPTRPEVEEVRFPGADAISEDRLQASIATTATTCRSPLYFLFCRIGDFSWAERARYLDRSELERDVERLRALYAAWGYPDARVDARVVPASDGDVEVVFEVDEGAPIVVASLDVRGLAAVTPALDPPRPLPLRVGRPYALPLLEATQDVLRAALAERGRPHAEVEVSGDIDEAAKRADVVLTIVPGPPAVFGEVLPRAAAPLDEELVLDRVAFEEGESFRPSALERTEARLRALPAVREVTIAPQGLAAGDTVIPVVVAVSPPERLQGIEFEGTISSAQCLQVAAFWRHRYFLGGPRLFSLGGGLSNLLAGTLGGFPCSDDDGSGAFDDAGYFARAELVQPWPGDPETTLLLRAFASRRTLPNVFLQEGFGGTVGVSHQFGQALTASLTYAPERFELEAAGIYFCGNFGFCTEPAIQALSEPSTFAPVEALALWTPFGTARAPLRPPPDSPELAPRPVPPWLYWARGSVDGAAGATLSDFGYVRGLAESGVTRRLGARSELAARVRVGALEGDELLPPQVRLFGGGVDGVRGLPQNTLGAKALVVRESELDELGCDPETATCPGGLAVGTDLVDARPLGGSMLLEAGLEARYWLTGRIQGALFVDYGALHTDVAAAAPAACSAPGGWEDALTPGIGVRVLTDFGPIRVDVGYDTGDGGVYPLLTRTEDAGLLCLGRVRYRPYSLDDDGTGELWRRLQVQVGFGQAF